MCPGYASFQLRDAFVGFLELSSGLSLRVLLGFLLRNLYLLRGQELYEFVRLPGL